MPTPSPCGCKRQHPAAVAVHWAVGVRTAPQEEGAVGILTGGLTAAAAGVTTSLVCGVVCSWVGKSHDQN